MQLNFRYAVKLHVQQEAIERQSQRSWARADPGSRAVGRGTRRGGVHSVFQSLSVVHAGRSQFQPFSRPAAG